MIKIHATKKLLAKLLVDERGLLPQKKNDSISIIHTNAGDNLLSSWHANLIMLQRRNCILWVHDQSRFALFTPCLKKADFAQLDQIFQGVLMDTLLKSNASQKQLDVAASLLQPLCFDSSCNRSVQGTMNQMAGSLDYMRYYDKFDVQKMSPYRTSVWLSDRPCTVKGQKGCVWPNKVMGALLGGGELLSELVIERREGMIGDDSKGSDNVIKIEDYR